MMMLEDEEEEKRLTKKRISNILRNFFFLKTLKSPHWSVQADKLEKQKFRVNFVFLSDVIHKQRFPLSLPLLH